MAPNRAGDDSASVIEGLLNGQLSAIENAAKGDVLAYFGPIVDDVHDIVRAALDNLDPPQKKLVVILETNGGYAESAEHGRGIPMSVLVEGLNLKIDDFGKDPILGPAVRQYYVLLKDYMLRRGHQIVWHTRRGHNGL